jgi:hypothetical protein
MITHQDIDLVGYVRPVRRDSYENKAKDFWWPFWAWRVIAPKEANDTDIFRELILKLINAGCNNAATISDLSGLHKDFVLHLVAITQGAGELDGWQLTDRGRNILEKGFDLSAELKSYYILQDAGSENLLPRVFSDFDYIDNIEVANKRVSYVNNRSKGGTRSPFMIREFGGAPSQPAIDEIYGAIRQHRKDQRKLKQAGFDADAVDISEAAVDYLDDMPIAIFMNLQVFVDRAGDRSWYVSDPAGLFPSLPILNDAADKRLESDKFFAERINELLGIAVEGNGVSYSERNDMLEEIIRVQLVSKYSWASKIPLVEDHVLQMLRNHYDLQSCPYKKNWKVKRLALSLQNACESIIKTIINPRGDRRDWEAVKFNNERNQRQQIKAIYRQRCRSVDDDLAGYFSGIPSSDIRTAMQRGGHSLRHQMAALVLLRPSLVDEIDSECPGWLHSVKGLSKNRNPAAHGNGDVLNVESVNKDFEFMEILLKVIERNMING